MDTMIERVARAMYARHFDESKRPWASANEDYRTPYLRDARVAIEAMREPTQAMIDAGGVYAEYSIKAAWQEMIDAALRD